MRIPDPRRRVLAGFSLAEMVIALFFTGILMAGLARVFKGSFTTFVTANEGLSALRKNRMALDMLMDDLNQTGMYLAQLSSPPGGLSSTNEPFRIDPNVTTDAVSGKTSDQLVLFWDEPLPFEPVLYNPGGGATAPKTGDDYTLGSMTQNIALNTGLEESYVLDCKDAVLAKRAEAMMNKSTNKPTLLHRGDVGHPMGVKVGSATANGTRVSFTTASVDWTPLGATGQALFLEARPQFGDPYLLVNARQQFRYSLVNRTVGPGLTAPCLVREQGTYNATSFTADDSLTTVVAEYVEQFKVYISGDNGTTWIGLTGTVPANWAAMKNSLATSLGTSGRSGAGSDMTNIHWYREIPTMLRVDVTTRTPVKRAEYGGTAAGGFQTKTQSLVVMPRHFGLPY